MNQKGQEIPIMLGENGIEIGVSDLRLMNCTPKQPLTWVEYVWCVEHLFGSEEKFISSIDDFSCSMFGINKNALDKCKETNSMKLCIGLPERILQLRKFKKMCKS